MTHPSNTSPAVNVLLSTYNGAPYLKAQLDSILQQEGAQVKLHLRDDGSSDNTVSILKDYANQHNNIDLQEGENLGVVNSFFDLLRNADSGCRYFAFCDQDDFWLPRKMANAVETMERGNNALPQLYFCRLEYVDESLGHIGYAPLPKQLGFGNALVQNLATGCTVVINDAARRLILSRQPRRAMMHDWWSYLVVSAFGNVTYDDRVGIKYRQHTSNEVGGTPLFFESMKRRFRRFVDNGKHVFRVSEQAIEFIRCHGERLPDPHRQLAQRFLASKSNFMTRMRYAAKMDVWRNTRLDDFILRVMILIDRY